MEKTLVMYEISQKQHYIFRSNRLRENIGASMIIRLLTEQPYELLKRSEWGFDVPAEEFSISGGGNGVYVFDTDEKATAFAKALSLGVLKNLPGIELFLVKQTMDWNKEKLFSLKDEQGRMVEQGVLDQMRSRLAEKKNQRRYAVRQVSWGIHRQCPDSGLPANLMDPTTETFRARELVVKAEYGRDARDEEYVRRFLSGLAVTAANGKPFQFLDQDHLERSLGEGKSAKNYVAVVHIDGNAMGVKVGAFLRQNFRSNDEYVKEYDKFTRKIDQAYTNAFRSMIEHVMRDYDNWSKRIYGESEDLCLLYAHIVPLRPIVASGDDICFLSFGQLGIELARVFIQYLQKSSLPVGQETFPFEACAGVAIVRRKFPFWLAYELSERLCSQAKKRLKSESDYWKNKTGQEHVDMSLIDWELVKSGDLDLDLSTRRENMCRNQDGTWLLNRPYYLFRQGWKHSHPSNYMNAFLPALETVHRASEESDGQGTLPAYPRSKWKELLGVYRKGRVATEQWAIQNRFDIGQKLFMERETHADLVAYFYDAIEIMDFLIPLPEVK